MSSKKDGKSYGQIFVKCLIGIIISLITLMLIVVVRDRCVFHKKVYDIALSEINEQKKADTDSTKIDSLRKCVCLTDTLLKSKQTSFSSTEARNHNEIKQTVNINNNTDPIEQITEDISSIIDTLKDTDGLISANGITYLISLIVALLIALVSDRVIAMENLMREMNNLKATIEDSVNIQIQQLDKKIKEKTQHTLRTNYNHATNYNSILNRIGSLYNHTILIDNTLSSEEINEKISCVIGLICSRINLIYDDLMARFKNTQQSLNFITSDERQLLYIYIEDILLCLSNNLMTLKKGEYDDLSTIIQDKIYLMEDIRDKIDAIQVKDDI